MMNRANKINLKRSLILIFFVLMIVPLSAQMARVCGIYKVIGKLQEEDGQYRIVLKEGSNSETRIYFGHTVPEGTEEFVGDKVEAEVFIMEKGMFIFRAELIEIIDVISILDDPDEYRSDWELLEERDCVW